MIGAGIIAALMVNHFVFPRHCRVRPPPAYVMTPTLIGTIRFSSSQMLVNHCRYSVSCTCLTVGEQAPSSRGTENRRLWFSRHMIQGGQIYSTSARQITLQRELEIRGALHRLSLLLLAMNDELSLLPVSNQGVKSAQSHLTFCSSQETNGAISPCPYRTTKDP